MQVKKSLRSYFITCLVLLPIAIGCGDGVPKGKPLAPAKGVVKYNGKPVAGATVLFSPKDGSPSTGMTDKDGNFTVTTGGRPGAELGKCKVLVTKTTATADGKPPAAMSPKDMEKMASSGMFSQSAKSEIPARYTSLEGTNLEADVSADGTKNVFEFNLVD
jgi:hypothetical protein